MTYSTSTSTRRGNTAFRFVLSLAYAIVIGAVAYALPVASLLKQVTPGFHAVK